MKIIDIADDIDALYTNGSFDPEAWKRFLCVKEPSLAPVCMQDLQESLSIGLSWENDYLPVLNELQKHPESVNAAKLAFAAVTNGLERKCSEKFGRAPEAKIILYPGLCNGAGWVTKLDGETVVLCGIEKIVELGWCNVDDMNGLILHELGHVYQEQFGVLRRNFDRSQRRFLWQLFTEGVAMVFEQEIVGGDYFHQDKNGWKNWCDAHLSTIASDFARDLPDMTQANQRYFGDWVEYEGRPDVGYYLGARFVRSILRECPFDTLIRFEIEEVERRFRTFLEATCGN